MKPEKFSLFINYFLQELIAADIHMQKKQQFAWKEMCKNNECFEGTEKNSLLGVESATIRFMLYEPKPSFVKRLLRYFFKNDTQNTRTLRLESSHPRDGSISVAVTFKKNDMGTFAVSIESRDSTLENCYVTQ